MYQSMVSDLLESEIGSIFVLLAVMGLGYVNAGWLKKQSRKRCVAMVSDLLENEKGSIFVLLAVMVLGYVTAGWLKEQSRKRYDEMVSDLLESEIGSIFVLLAVMGLGYVTAGWLKEQSRKPRDAVDEVEHMRRELEAFRQEMQTKKLEPFISGGSKGSFAAGEGLETDDSAGEEEEEDRAAKAVK